VIDLVLDDEWDCQLPWDQLNCLRLDRFRFNDGPLIEPKPLINVFQDLTLAGQLWPGSLSVAPVFGAPPRIELKLPATASYETTFEVRHMPSRAVLCIEDAALSGTDWEISLNESALVFQPHRRWSIDNREADIAPLLRFGSNTVRVRIQARESWDGLLDALYMLGDFGVFPGLIIDKLPTRLRWPDRHTSGFPYFSGTMRLGKTISVHAEILRLPDDEMMFAGVAELKLDGQSLGVRAWAPYEWRVPTGRSRSEVILEITNTLIEQLEGKRYDPRLRRVIPVFVPRTGGT
jgi:hypothetical protein